MKDDDLLFSAELCEGSLWSGEDAGDIGDYRDYDEMEGRDEQVDVEKAESTRSC